MSAKSRQQRKHKKRTGNRSEYWQECGKKNRYSTPETAGYAAERVKRERGVNCRVYHCVKFCGKWHLSEDD